MKNKFKIGDKVIVNTQEEINYFGEIGTIDEDDYCPWVKFEHLDRNCFYERDLELVEIFNSPLFKAMREENDKTNN